MKNESYVTSTLLTGAQVNILQMEIDKYNAKLDREQGINYEEEVSTYDEIKELLMGFLFKNMVELNNHIKQTKK